MPPQVGDEPEEFFTLKEKGPIVGGLTCGDHREVVRRLDDRVSK